MSGVASAALPSYLRGAPGRSRQLPALLLIAALHLLALLLLLQMRQTPTSKPVPTLMVSLISAAPPETPPPPPKRKPPPQPQLIAAPQPAPTAMQAPPLEEMPPTAPPPAPEPAAPPALIPPNFIAAYLNNPAPSYPSLSIRLREEGTVLLLVRVSAEGRAEQVQVEQSSGFARLDEAAANVVRQRWRFVPAKQGEQPVSAWVRIPLSFELKKHE